MLANKPTKVTVKRRLTGLKPEAPHRYVDFFTNAQDFLCVMLAALGWSTRAIAEHTSLSEGQVSYRIGKSEQGRKKNDLTQRMAYRNGKGDVAHVVVSTIAAKGSTAHKAVTRTLDGRGLYSPKSSGVLRHDRKAEGHVKQKRT
jgi:hypothetical protein